MNHYEIEFAVGNGGASRREIVADHFVLHNDCVVFSDAAGKTVAFFNKFAIRSVVILEEKMTSSDAAI